MPEYSDLWIADYKANADAYAEVVEMDPCEGWEENTMPEGTIEDGLRDGLRVLYGDPDSPVASKLFEQCVVAGDRALSDDVFLSSRCADGFPKNRGRALRAHAYARALLGGGADVDALRQASVDYEEWCAAYPGGEWDAQAQANYLSGVRLALIADDVDRARDLLATNLSLKWHEEEHVVLLRALGTVDQAPAHDPYLERYFDRLRNPRFQSDVFMELDIVRFEIGVIREKQDRPISELDWRRAARAVSA